jgi:hypothetical protein
MKTQTQAIRRMKSSVRIAALLVGIVAPIGMLAQSYMINWWTIDGGGGTSTGGVYSVRGTIGQPDASKAMTGGNYSLTGGFWALHAVQVEGAPYLTIVAAGPGMAEISWTPDTPGWILQESPIVSSNWVDSASGSANPVTVPTAGTNRFYRLHKP